MQKVYLVLREHLAQGKTGWSDGERYTDIIHICKDADIAVEKANEYIIDFISDIMSQPTNNRPVYCDMGKYYTKEDLMSQKGSCFISFENNEKMIVEVYNIKIEEHEVKED